MACRILLSLALIIIVVLLFADGAKFSKEYKDGSAGGNGGGRKELEQSLRKYEISRFRDAYNEMTSKGFTLKGFYHTSAWQDHWKTIIAEQLMIMDGRRIQASAIQKYEDGTNDTIPWTSTPKTFASVLSAIDSLHMTVAGPSIGDLDKIAGFVNSLGLANRQKIQIFFNQTVPRQASKEDIKKLEDKAGAKLSTGEFSTITALHDYCVAETNKGAKALVFYVHSKGACCTRGSTAHQRLPVATWREFMNTFNLEFPSICLVSLLQGYSSCGVNFQHVPGIMPHFSGNFWWARCDHVARLPRPANPYDAWALEYYLFEVNPGYQGRVSFSNKCVKGVHHCKVNHYDQECKRVAYLPVLAQSVLTKPDFNDDPSRADACKKSWK